VSELEAFSPDAPALTTAVAPVAASRVCDSRRARDPGAAVEYPLAFALKSLDRSELVRALPFLGVTIVLAALIRCRFDSAPSSDCRARR